jgi:hypothetical protein
VNSVLGYPQKEKALKSRAVTCDGSHVLHERDQTDCAINQSVSIESTNAKRQNSTADYQIQDCSKVDIRRGRGRKSIVKFTTADDFDLSGR